MTIYLKQSTASQEVPIGPFVDSTDGVTAETALTIANTDIKIWVAGATTLANKNSGGATHISGGIYYAVLDATDTATLGSLKIFVAVSGALACVVECIVMAANIYDSLVGGGDVLDVSVTQFAGSAITSAAGIPEVKVASLAAGSITASVIATGAVDADALATDAVNEIADGVWDEATSGHTTAGTTGKALSDAGAAGSPPSASAIADAVWDEDLAGHVAAGSAGLELGSLSSDMTSIISSQITIASSTTAIKAKTDSLGFTVAGQVDANIQYVNDTQVQGVGADGNEWRPV